MKSFKINFDYRRVDRRISYDNNDRGPKRSRLIEDEVVRRNDRREDNFPPIRRPTVQSAVRMPIETKSRDQTIAERERSQRGEDGARQLFCFIFSNDYRDFFRNRRMFGNLLLGTLKQFKQEQKAPAVQAQVNLVLLLRMYFIIIFQTEKLKEVDEKLQKAEREAKEKFIQEKKSVEMKLREKEMEIKRLKQKGAIQAKVSS